MAANLVLGDELNESVGDTAAFENEFPVVRFETITFKAGRRWDIGASFLRSGLLCAKLITVDAAENLIGRAIQRRRELDQRPHVERLPAVVFPIPDPLRLHLHRLREIGLGELCSLSEALDVLPEGHRGAQHRRTF